MNNLDNPYSDEPSSARIYDYWLGGTYNFPIDRMAAD
ncbi:MAG: SAM-dependent methyltransferase, partial [Chloroflexota bacterium]